MKEHELWEMTVEVLETYFSDRDVLTCTIDDVAQDVLSACVFALSDVEAAFVRECAAGVVRFEALCEGALQGFCNAFRRNRANKLSMYLMAYVMIFRYEEVGGATKVRELFSRSTFTPRIAEYVRYLLDRDLLETHSRPLWAHHYGTQFIEDTVLAALDNIRDDAAVGVVHWFFAKATTPVSRMLDDANASQSLLPEGSDSVANAIVARNAQEGSEKKGKAGRAQALRHPRSSPDTTRLPPAEVREMAAAIPEKRPPPARVTEVPALIKSTKPLTHPVGFDFHARQEGQRRRQSIENSSAASSGSVGAVEQRTKPDLRAVRRILAKEVHVRPTEAALRREAHTHALRNQNELRALADKELNMRDSTEYEAWRQAQLAAQKETEAKLVLERQLEAIEAPAKVQASREQQQRKKLKRQQAIRAVEQVEEARAEKEKRALQQRKRGFVQDLRSELQKGRTEAEERCRGDKEATADEVRREKDKLKAEAQQREEERRVEQAFIIQEIRMLRVRVRERQAELRERNRVARGNTDVNAASAHISSAATDDGLGVMSVVELRAELIRVREQDRTEREARHARIVASRAENTEAVAALESECLAARERRRAQRHTDKETKNASEAVREAQRLGAETNRMLELHSRLEAKRAERKTAMAAARVAARQNRNETLLRAEDETALEKQRWRQLELGTMNRAAAKQRRFVEGLRTK